MRPLTDAHPKPLLKVQGKPLMQWMMEALWHAQVQDLVINTAWLEAQIPEYFGDAFVPEHAVMQTQSMALHYSKEGRDFGGALETAGGIVRALPWLDDVFWVSAGDVFVPDFKFDWAQRAQFETSAALAHLWLVPNPEHNPKGDFGLSAHGHALNVSADSGVPRYTFSTIALYKRAFFEAAWCPIKAGNPQGVKAPLAAMLRQAMDAGQVTASLYDGIWVDVGTPQRLAQLNA
jgi:MurNAc alpha-1-phosphate uridylyltransferase